MKQILALLLCISPAAFADLSQDQKVSDFTQLAALYARNYAPYELKRDAFGFDLYNIAPWLAKVKASASDLEFYDICVKYVASLQDSHDEFTMNSDYEAYIPLTIDLYDGKALIDGIGRTTLPASRYPFTVGDEVISVDGKTMAAWMADLQPYAVNGASNPTSRNRLALGAVFDRIQAFWPTAPLSLVGDSAMVVVLRQSTGAMETYTIPWKIYGTAIMGEGPIPAFNATARLKKSSAARRPRAYAASSRLVPRGDSEVVDHSGDLNPWGIWTGERPAMAPDAVPDYMKALQLLTETKPLQMGGLFPFGDIFPVFNPPPGFRIRLGVRSTDLFLSGTFTAGGKTIGFIRIPDMAPPSQTTALNQFVAEILFFQQNTDGLVIDVMANGGGSGCYTQTLVSLLTPQKIRGLSAQIRATQLWVASVSSSLTSAQLNNAPQYVIDQYAAILKDVKQAFSENRGRTGSLPLCGYSADVFPPTDGRGNILSYTKPILALTDNYTLSAGEVFVMMLQDEGRATLFGDRTDGGGGNVVSFDAGAYSEGNTRMTMSIITRKSPVATPGFPSLEFYDGVGIYPDIFADYQTEENLKTGGQAFVASFTSAILDLIAKSAQ